MRTQVKVPESEMGRPWVELFREYGIGATRRAIKLKRKKDKEEQDSQQ
jgi:hypothetical protein